MKLILLLDENGSAKVHELEMQQPMQLRFDFHGVKLQVCTNSSYLVNHLKLGYSFFITSDNSEPHFSLLALEAGESQYREFFSSLFPSRMVKDHILVSRQLGLIFFLQDRPLLAYYTVKILFGQVIFFLREQYLALHAAGVAYNGIGLLLCGAARCGKTVLSTLLMGQDFSYLSDDVTLLARKSLKVVPFPRALTIREEYEPLVASLLARAHQSQRFKIADQERLLVDLVHPISGEVKPNLICLPKYEPNRKTQLRPVSPCITLPALMYERFHPLVGSIEKYDDEDFEILVRFLDQVSCFSLVYSDPVEAAHMLKEIILKEITDK